MKKILVIDDSDVNLYLVQTIFEDHPDIEIIMENDSTKTIDDIKSNKPDLVVLDLMMPHIDGFELLHKIKNSPEMANIKIIVVSAFLTDENIEKIEQYGITNFLHKPISLDEAEIKIRNMLFE